MGTEAGIRDFWDERAREDPFYFVDNTGRYGDPDTERFWAGGEQTLDKILAVLDVSIPADAKVLEIGCGLGRITRALARRSRSVVALDVSPEMVAQAQAHNAAIENVRWLVGDGRSLAGIENESVDICHSHVVFQHIPDPQITLNYVREMGRVLTPGGFAFFQVSNAPELHRPRPLRQRVMGALRSRLRRAPKGQADPAWLGSAVELGALGESAQEAGMRLANVIGEGTQFCLVHLERPEH